MGSICHGLDQIRFVQENETRNILPTSLFYRWSSKYAQLEHGCLPVLLGVELSACGDGCVTTTRNGPRNHLVRSNAITGGENTTHTGLMHGRIGLEVSHRSQSQPKLIDKRPFNGG